MKKKTNINFFKLLLFFILCSSSFISFSTPLPDQGFVPGVVKKHLSREFVKNQNEEFSSGFINNSNSHNYKGGISLGLTEMQQIYQTSDIEYNFTEEGISYTMDIGTVDYVNSQTWIMPNYDFVEYELGENINASTSPYYNEFQTATHLQYYDYSEWNEFYYEYYKFSADKIEIIGGVDEYQGDIEYDTLSYLVTPLPLDVNTDFVMEDEFVFNDTTYYYSQYVYSEGFGTLQTPEGTFNALKLANEFYEEIHVGGNLINSYDAIIYTFYCENGYRVNLYLNSLSATTGTVDIDFVDVEIPSALNNVTELSKQSDFCYPNPANNILNFNQHGNYEIFNSLGVNVLSLKNIQNADISNLNSGLYFVKSETGKTQKIIINQ